MRYTLNRAIVMVVVVSMAALSLIGVQVASQRAASAAGALVTVPNGITTADLSSAGVTPTSLAQQLAGAGVTVSNVTYSGANAQAGRIHVTDPAVVSFNDGVIMSSGNVADIVGPNKSDSTTGDMAGPGDADLNALITSSQTVFPATFDASVLKFDFVPTASQVYFTYTFGSDEYLEWVNLFNDVFGFFVNGVNCATVAGGASVSIDTINSSVNPGLFRDNAFSSPVANPINIESDGLSVEMICSAPVNAGKVNHMKLAIADTSDQILDSVVMIKANSLSTVAPESCNNGVDDNSDGKVDMSDPKCQTTTTPAPPKAKGIGSAGNFPPFTGNEGSPILLDASALGWAPTPDAVSTTWDVTGINGTVGTCTVDPSGAVAIEPDGSIAQVMAVCPKDGEYVAHVWGWDSEGNSPFDYDVDFFVHNAPPAVSIDSPWYGDSYNVGDTVNLSASILDPGINDSVTCSLDWGDGTHVSGLFDNSTGNCTGSHVYGGGGQQVLTVTATDNAHASAASAVVLDVQGPSNLAAPTVSKDPSSVTLAAGSTASFSVLGVGVPAPSVQWQMLPVGGSWTNIAGATKSSYSVSATKLLANVQYRAVFTNSSGTVATAPAALNLVAVTKFVPNSGGVGTSITLTGTNLGGVTGVKFAGTSAPFTVISATQVLTSVPAGATKGSIVVSTTGGDVTTNTFTVATKDAAPTITAFTPGIVRPGSSAIITLTGTNLAGATSVTLGSTTLGFTVLAVNTLSVNLPATGVATDLLSVTTAGGSVSSASAFQIAAAPTQVTAGLSHSCARLSDSTARCWGLNANGQLGDGTTTNRTSPTPVSGLTGVSSVAAGAGFSCAVLNAGPSGTVKCWGLNSSGQLGDGTLTQRTSPVAVTGLSGVISVTAGDAFACALRSDASVRCWGANASGQLGNGAITASSTPVLVGSLSGVSAIDAGGATACARLSTGALRCWGQNTNGQVGNGSSSTTAVSTPVPVTGIDGAAAKASSVSVGTGFACAGMLSGAVRCWGLNSKGQLGDGTLVQRTSPVTVLTGVGVALGDVSTVSAGASHVCAIVGSGETALVRCWGLNSSGQLGIGTLVSASYAATTSVAVHASAIACGGSHTVTLAPSAAMGHLAIAWGLNSSGQLGDGTTTKHTAPVALPGL
jgi:alpha-tubulin suppressor-like RCC1 family protein